MPSAQQVSQALAQINQEMIRLDLWQSTSPSDEALASIEPFCCDTLSFAQWLEFILLPKMNMLIESNLPLPQYFLILPMAQESFHNLDIDTRELLNSIARLDSLFAATK